VTAAQSRDDDLMARYRRGDEAAFEAIYLRYEERVFGFCLRFLGDPDAASDAFQETFRRLVDARDAYRPQGRFQSWIFTLARRACLDHLRSAKRESSVADAWGETADGAELVESVAGRMEDHDEARRLLALLPPEQREVLLLSKYYGFGYGEIAEMLGSTQVAVKQKGYRALKTLRAHLEKPRE
jgi:RNA polymerase sigma-70 factor, ECF subfamily